MCKLSAQILIIEDVMEILMKKENVMNDVVQVSHLKMLLIVIVYCVIRKSTMEFMDILV